MAMIACDECGTSISDRAPSCPHCGNPMDAVARRSVSIPIPPATVRREIRKRGFFGWLFLLLFLAFNVLMVVWLFDYWSHLSNTVDASEAARTGKLIGGTLGTGVLMFVWVMGSVILGLLAILTRGSRRIIEEVR
jgi:hypothetical protein